MNEFTASAAGYAFTICAMAIPPRREQQGTFFVTSRTWNSRNTFQVIHHAELFLATLQHYRHEGHYRLHAFVVMPDHIHLLLTTQSSIEKVVALIKGGFSHRMQSKFPVWQRGFTDRRLRNAYEFEVRKRYIHDNPVRARLVELPEQYRFSSAYRAPVVSDPAAEAAS